MTRSTYDLTLPGWAIMFAVACLFAMGLICIRATELSTPVWRSMMGKQIVVMLLGLAAFALILRLGYKRIGPWSYFIFVSALLMLVPLVIARYVYLGAWSSAIRGAHRWIQLPGFNFQPSEIMKVAYILGLAWYLRFRKNYRSFGGLLGPFLITLVPMFLILVEPDLGTVLLMMPVLFAMLFVAGAKLRHMSAIVLIGLLCVPLLWFKMHGYQRLRIAAMLMQSEGLRDRIMKEPRKWSFLCTPREAREWPVSSGLQLVCSKAALGSGGVTGTGWGEGTYVRYNFLPDKHNDFIFSIIGHQWGLFGCVFVLSCYGLIAAMGARIASATHDPFGRLLAVGVVALLAAQAAINVGMTMGLMPITGMTLPFVSYGGSSLVVNFMAVALLISVSQNRPFLLMPKPFEFGRE